MKPETYPKYSDSHQSYIHYVLTDQDMLCLYALLSPSEIIGEFGNQRSRSDKSIYKLIRTYGLDRPFKARKYLEKIIMAACPEEYGFDDWEELLKRQITFVRAEAIGRMWKRIHKHESLWEIN